jgi:hypothetical protein
LAPPEITDVSIIDWDLVTAVPLKMSTMSLRDRFYDSGYLLEQNIRTFHISQSVEFKEELERLEYQHSSSNKLSELYSQSHETRFLLHLLCYCWNFSQLKEYFPEIMAEAGREDPTDIAAEWEIFTNEFYISRGNPVPDWPQYVEIQERLGIYVKAASEASI